MEITYSVTEAALSKALSVADLRCRTDINKPLYMKLLLGLILACSTFVMLGLVGLFRKYGFPPFVNDLSWVLGFSILGIVGFVLYALRYK